MIARIKLAAAAIAVTLAGSAVALADGPAYSRVAPASDPFTNFQVKVGLTGVIWNDHNNGVFLNGGPIAGADASVSNVLLPTATLTYFFSPKLSAELFCCFAKPRVNGEGTLAVNGKLADTWAFPPIVTLKYHFDKVGGVRPYIGAGVEYIKYFDSRSTLPGFTSVKFADSWGPVAQAGFDYELGGGWSVGMDAKYVWESTKLTFTGGANTITTKHDLDPLLLTVNMGYRFNLEDLLHRRASYEPLK
jgi:outer membrane protein